MAREFARKFYNSKQWKTTRQAYFNMRHGICERCFGKDGPGYIVHHKEYISPQNIHDPNVTLAFSNLELLCLSCHNTEHMADSPTRPDVMFDLEGNLIERR